MVLMILSGCGDGVRKRNQNGVYEPSSGDVAPGKLEVLGIEYANSVLNSVEIGGKKYDLKLEIVIMSLPTTRPSAAAKIS